MCSCIKGMVRCLMYIINLAFFLVGAAMLGIGIWLLVDDSALSWINDMDLNVTVGPDDPLWVTACAVIISVGAFLFLVGFTGCCGVQRNSSCLLCVYIILVTVCIVLEVVAIIMAIVFNANIGGVLGDAMKENIQEHYSIHETDTDPTTAAWNALQFERKCCGARQYQDWEGSQFALNNIDERVPFTCCVMNDNDVENPTPGDVLNRVGCAAESETGPTDGIYQYLHPNGCSNVIRDDLQSYMHIIIGICAGIILLQILGLIVACNARDEAKMA